MRNKAISISLITALISGCGSGSTPAPAPGNQITGKTGSKAVVFLKDLTGAETTTDADATGNYAINIDGMKKPYVLKAVYSNASTVYAVAPNAGTTNINSGSSTLLRVLAGVADLAAWYLALKADILLWIAGLIENLVNASH